MENTSTADRASKRVALYIRVSTREQEMKGFEREAQERALRDYIRNNPSLGLQYTAIDVYKDTWTGSESNRKAFQKLIADVRARKIGVVVAWKIDRISRTVKNMIAFIEFVDRHGATFLSVQDNVDYSTPGGRFHLNVMSSVAEMERSSIQLRTHSGKVESAMRGNYTGAVAPYGYCKRENPKAKKGSILEIVEVAELTEPIDGWI